MGVPSETPKRKFTQAKKKGHTSKSLVSNSSKRQKRGSILSTAHFKLHILKYIFLKLFFVLVKNA